MSYAKNPSPAASCSFVPLVTTRSTRRPGREYDDLLVIRTPGAAEKAALVEADGPFFTIDHFRNFNAVLVRQSRLGEVDVDELTEVITDAWLAVAPKRLVKEFLA